MTKRQDIARHRAAQTTGSLDVLTKAVASNAGTMGRQAAVIAAAGGLVVTLGVSGAQAATQKTADLPQTDANTASLDIQRTAATTVVAAKTTTKSFKATLPVVKVVAAPAKKAATASTAKGKATTVVADSSGSASTSTSTTKSSSSSSSSTKSSTKSTDSSSSSSASDTSADTTTTASSSGQSGVAASAESYLGAPYVLGGNTPSGWDCSGFVRWVYAQNGMNITARTAAGIWTGGQFVKTNNPKPGDIIIQRNGKHIAIYMGGSKYIGAQNPSSGTAWRDLDTTYDTFNGYYTWVG